MERQPANEESTKIVAKSTQLVSCKEEEIYEVLHSLRKINFIEMFKAMQGSQDGLMKQSLSLEKQQNAIKVSFDNELKEIKAEIPIVDAVKTTIDSSHEEVIQSLHAQNDLLFMELEDNDEKKNAILEPLPHPEHTEDLVRCLIVTNANQKRNVNDGAGFRWRRINRLDMLRYTI